MRPIKLNPGDQVVIVQHPPPSRRRRGNPAAQEVEPEPLTDERGDVATEFEGRDGAQAAATRALAAKGHRALQWQGRQVECATCGRGARIERAGFRYHLAGPAAVWGCVGWVPKRPRAKKPATTRPPELPPMEPTRMWPADARTLEREAFIAGAFKSYTPEQIAKARAGRAAREVVADKLAELEEVADRNPGALVNRGTVAQSRGRWIWDEIDDVAPVQDVIEELRGLGARNRWDATKAATIEARAEASREQDRAALRAVEADPFGQHNATTRARAARELNRMHGRRNAVAGCEADRKAAKKEADEVARALRAEAKRKRAELTQGARASCKARQRAATKEGRRLSAVIGRSERAHQGGQLALLATRKTPKKRAARPRGPAAGRKKAPRGPATGGIAHGLTREELLRALGPARAANPRLLVLDDEGQDTGAPPSAALVKASGPRLAAEGAGDDVRAYLEEDPRTGHAEWRPLGEDDAGRRAQWVTVCTREWYRATYGDDA